MLYCKISSVCLKFRMHCSAHRSVRWSNVNKRLLDQTSKFIPWYCIFQIIENGKRSLVSMIVYRFVFYYYYCYYFCYQFIIIVIIIFHYFRRLQQIINLYFIGIGSVWVYVCICRRSENYGKRNTCCIETNRTLFF